MERSIVQNKVVIIGMKEVGKTSLIHAFQQLSDDVLPTVAAEVYHCIISKGTGGNIRMDIWDTAGSEQYGCLVPLYSRGALVAILVYSQNSRESYDYIRNQYEYLSKEIGIEKFIIACNKSDEKEDVQISEVREWARPLDIRVIKTSAKNSQNVINLFVSTAYILEEVTSQYEPQPQPIPAKNKKDIDDICI